MARQKLIHLHGSANLTKEHLEQKQIEFLNGEIAVQNSTKKGSALYIKSTENGELAKFITADQIDQQITDLGIPTIKQNVTDLKNFKTEHLDDFVNDYEKSEPETFVKTLGKKAGNIDIDSTTSSSDGVGKVTFTLGTDKILKATAKVAPSGTHDEDYYATDKKVATLEDKVTTNKGYFDNVTGFAGNYSRNSGATYIKGQDVTNLNTADIKLDKELARVEQARKDVTGVADDTYTEITDPSKNPYLNGSKNLLDADTKLQAGIVIVDGKVATEAQSREEADNAINAELGDNEREVSGNTGNTAFGRIRTLETKVDALGSATHFIGKFTALPGTVGEKADQNAPKTGVKGDVVIVGDKEYIYNGEDGEYVLDSWVELGDTTAERSDITTLQQNVKTLQNATKGFTEVSSISNAINAAKDAGMTKVVDNKGGQTPGDEDGITVALDSANSSKGFETYKVKVSAGHFIPTTDWKTDKEKEITTLQTDVTNLKNNKLDSIGVTANTRGVGVKGVNVTIDKPNTTTPTINFENMVIDCGSYE